MGGDPGRSCREMRERRAAVGWKRVAPPAKVVRGVGVRKPRPLDSCRQCSAAGKSAHICCVWQRDVRGGRRGVVVSLAQGEFGETGKSVE